MTYDVNASKRAWSEGGGAENGPWAAGWYPGKIGKVQLGVVPKSGRGEMAVIGITVKAPDGAKKELTWRGCYRHPNQVAQDIALRAMGQLHELTGVDNPDLFEGKLLDVRIGLTTWTNDQGNSIQQNEVKGFAASGSMKYTVPQAGNPEDVDDEIPF